MYLSQLLSALLLSTIVESQVPHPSKQTSRIIPTPEYLRPLQSSQLEVRVFEDGDFLDLAAATVEWTNPWNILDFSDQEGTTVRATPSIYDGDKVEMTLVTAMVTLDDRTYNVSRYVKIFRPWGKEIKHDMKMEVTALPSHFYPPMDNMREGEVTYGSLPWAEDVYFAGELWILSGFLHVPTYDEAIWKPDVPGHLKSVYKAGADLELYANVQMTSWNRSEANIYTEYTYAVEAAANDVYIVVNRTLIDHPAFVECEAEYPDVTLAGQSMLAAGTQIHFLYGNLDLLGVMEINGSTTIIIWSFNNSEETSKPSAVPSDPNCRGDLEDPQEWSKARIDQ